MAALSGDVRTDVGVAARPREGEVESGDGAVVLSRGGSLLLAVVDALGHGPEAARVRRAAEEVLTGWVGETPPELILACHAALRLTRGAALSIAVVGSRSVCWSGVGNVEGVVLERGAGLHWLVQRPGVVGWRVPGLRSDRVPLPAGSTLILASDGITPGFEALAQAGGSPDDIARAVLAGFGREDDDATVLVARPGESWERAW